MNLYLGAHEGRPDVRRCFSRCQVAGRRCGLSGTGAPLAREPAGLIAKQHTQLLIVIPKEPLRPGGLVGESKEGLAVPKLPRVNLDQSQAD